MSLGDYVPQTQKIEKQLNRLMINSKLLLISQKGEKRLMQLQQYKGGCVPQNNKAK